MQKYDHTKIEKKWRAQWTKENVYRTTEDPKKEKFYILDMFPYPSGAGLHVGHPKGYIATDIISRYKKMKNFNVLHPMGWDAFGLPAEQYALEKKVHPAIATAENIKTFKEQLGKMSLNYDWEREISTTDPEFYKWTQWTFIQMFKKDLVYESNEPINWCPSCKTGLANEDLEGGACERCGTEVEKKPIRQWVIAITKYADRLLDDLKDLDWKENIKELQRNWIGRSEGLTFKSPVKDSSLVLETFSAHFEAFRADTFLVIAPDHPLLKELVAGTPGEQEVLEKADMMVHRRAQDKYGDKDIEGVFTGRYTIDPVGNGELPIWVASFALANYGTGVVKSSAHDERDFAFAKKYDIPLKAVLFPEDPAEREKVEKFEVCYTDMKKGILSEPAEFAGQNAGTSRKDIADYVEKSNLATRAITYRLKDWVFARQRYWGEPIPLIHCDSCGVVPVPEDQLPVVLPEVASYEPTGTGESPLAGIDEWVNTTCPTCNGTAKRETNTMPQWAGSSWYYLRYIDPKNNDALVNKDKEKYWSPVDFYVGGAEHATRHLIYARFWHKFLYDIGAVNYTEPFKKLQTVGLIHAEDGRKMSKRWGNVINPDDIIDTFGADTLRVYEMFMGPFDQMATWSTDGLLGPRRFLERIWKLQEHVTDTTPLPIQKELHKTIKKVSEDIEEMKYNTAVSTMMVLANNIDKAKSVTRADFESFLKILSPYAPHITQELWSILGNADFILESQWPSYDEELVVDEEANLVVQVNGKLRGHVQVPTNTSEEDVIAAIRSDEKLSEYLEPEPKRVIYVPNRLINLVV